MPVIVTFGAESWAAPRGERPNYLVAGELFTNVDFMPLSDSYTFTYTVVPMKLGIQNLPQFSISRRSNPKQNIEKQEAIKMDLINNGLLLNGFTSKIFVSTK